MLCLGQSRSPGTGLTTTDSHHTAVTYSVSSLWQMYLYLRLMCERNIAVPFCFPLLFVSATFPASFPFCPASLLSQLSVKHSTHFICCDRFLLTILVHPSYLYFTACRPAEDGFPSIRFPPEISSLQGVFSIVWRLISPLGSFYLMCLLFGGSGLGFALVGLPLLCKAYLWQFSVKIGIQIKWRWRCSMSLRN